MDSIDPHNSYVGQFGVIVDHLESVLVIQEQCDSIDLLNLLWETADLMCFCKGERRREAWSGDRRRRLKVDGEGREESGRRRDEAEDGLRDVIYVQASCKTTGDGDLFFSSGGIIQTGRILQEGRILQKQPRWQEGYCEGPRGAGKGNG